MIGKFDQIKHFLTQLPHAASKRFILFHCDDFNRDGFSGDLTDDCPVERQLMDVPVTAAIGFKPFQLIAGFEIHQTVFRTEPIHPDLTGDSAVVCPHHTFRNAVCQKIICDWMQPNTGLQLGDKAEVFPGNYLPILSRRPFCKSLWQNNQGCV